MRVRFPPSPTGPMHIGTARALLFNFLFARQQEGTIIFRSEDTDKERSETKFEAEILQGLKWLGLDFDEGPFRQSERLTIYEEYFGKLQKSGKIYPCFCTPEELSLERELQRKNKEPPRYAGKCRALTSQDVAQKLKAGLQPVWRFRVPQGEVAFQDLIRGQIREQGKHISDFVIRKANQQFLYHFTVVVDDVEMQISHVIRGEDHLTNTSKHLLLFDALGANRPQFAHLPLLLNADRSKMSKRDETGKPATLARLREEGYLPEAVLNFLVLLGWNPGDNQEFFSLADLKKNFSLTKIQKAGAVFNLKRLNFFNQNYLRQLSLKELALQVKPYLNFALTDEAKFLAALDLIRPKLKFLAEAPELLRCFFEEPDLDLTLFQNSKMQVTLATSQSVLQSIMTNLAQLRIQDWTRENLKEHLTNLIQNLGFKNGQVLWPLRVALTGLQFSPGAFEVAAVLGKEESLKRIQSAIDKIFNKL